MLAIVAVYALALSLINYRHAQWSQQRVDEARILDLTNVFKDALGQGPFTSAISLVSQELPDASLEEARRVVSQARALFPDHWAGNYMLACLRCVERDYERAATAMAESLELGAPPEFTINLARILVAADKPDEALDVLLPYMALYPDDLQGKFEKGKALYELANRNEYREDGSDIGRYLEALTLFDAVLAVEPGLANAHYFRGRCLGFMALNRNEEAITALSTALRLNPGNELACSDLRFHLAIEGHSNEEIDEIVNRISEPMGKP